MVLRRRETDGSALRHEGRCRGAASIYRSGGTWVFAPDGARIGVIRTPRSRLTCALADRSPDDLFTRAPQS